VSENGGNRHNSCVTPAIRVLLVCSSQLLSSALAALLAKGQDIAPVGIERDGESAAARLSEVRADIVLCCVWRPEDVPNMVAGVIAARPDIPVLVFGPVRSERMPLACLEAGAAGYISDNVDTDGLLQAIRRTHCGEVLFTRAVLAKLVHRRRRPRSLSRSGQMGALGPREIEVLQAVTQCLSTEEVAEQLSITVSTVRTHLKNILDKLGARSKIEAVIIGLRTGLITLANADVEGGVQSLLPVGERSHLARGADRREQVARRSAGSVELAR
jgi:DNA-binding NarL/FixJ family response regulator